MLTVVFDFGGVLVEIAPSLTAACHASRLPVRLPLDSPEIGARWSELDRLHQIGAVDTDEFFRQVGLALGGTYTAEELRRVHRCLLGAPYPGVDGFVRELHARGVRTGVLSNTNPGHWQALAHEYPDFQTLFTGFPRCVQASHLLGARKPDPAIYRAFVARTEIDPSELVFFDDFEENVRAAASEGWRAFRLDASGDTVTEMRSILARLI
jgi:glucose-1-phosphatase